MPLQQLNVRVPVDEVEQIRTVAKAKGISVGEYVRRAIAMQLAYERSLEVQLAYQRGLAARAEPRPAGADS